MAIFNKNGNKSVPKSETTLIAQGAYIKGEFHFESRLHVDGEIEGKILSNNSIIIGKNGIIRGELKAEKLVVNGIFEGKADSKVVEVLGGGSFIGDVVSEDLMIESKAHFEGTSNIRLEGKEELTQKQDEKDEEK